MKKKHLFPLCFLVTTLNPADLAIAGLGDLIGGAVKSGMQDAVIQHTYEKTFNTTKGTLNNAAAPPPQAPAPVPQSPPPATTYEKPAPPPAASPLPNPTAAAKEPPPAKREDPFWSLGRGNSPSPAVAPEAKSNGGQPTGDTKSGEAPKASARMAAESPPSAGSMSASPGPQTCSGTLKGSRWCEQGDGTVKDMSTGTIWLKDWSCVPDTVNSWDQSSIWSMSLASGKCGLNDGSKAGDWRLPSKNELLALISGEEKITQANKGPFGKTRPPNCWSSTTEAETPTQAYSVRMYDSTTSNDPKNTQKATWPVRGGQ